MRLIHSALLALASLAWVSPMQAQSREEFERCRATEDDDRRLACYDAIRFSSAAPRGKYEAVAFAELDAHALSYRERLVEVAGWIEPGERFFSLKAAAQETRALPVDFRQLSRSDLERFREQCGAGCKATVRGRVGPVNFTTGIAADALRVE